jgi:uncharacterized delta-60 repeat protein
MSGSKTPSIRGRWLLLAACLLAVLLIPAAQATPGALDPSFGPGGKVTTAIGSADDEGEALALQPDGKVVVAGYGYDASIYDIELARYNPNGSLDTSFNGTGKVTTAIGSTDDEAYALALQPDGKLVVAGYSYNGTDYDLAVVRYDADGSLDTSFNGTGKVTTGIGSNDDGANALVLQPNGKLVAAGWSYNGSDYDFALVRYNADGSLDTSLNGTGKVTTAIGAGRDVARALALQPNGKLVVAGESSNGSNNDFALVRYNADGSLDTSFNGTGKVTTAIGSGPESANALALQPDGKLVAAGLSYQGTPSSNDFALARYNPNGSLDTSFNGTGKVTTAIGPADNVGYALALQLDGKLVAAGSSWNGANYDFALARYNSNGTLDSTFNGTGKVTTAIGSGVDVATALALQPNGKLVAAGYSRNGFNNFDVALARYNGSTLTVAKTGSGSGSVKSSLSGINCGAICSAPFAAVPVTLTATSAAGSAFVGWSGACSGTGACTVTMSADHAVTARFEAAKMLTLAKAGSGTGTVTSNPAGISCGSACAHAFTYGASVTLTAVASAGSQFAGWTGDCSGTGSCTVTMSAARSVSATFNVLCVVPKVKGKTLRAAKRALSRAHCSAGKVTKAFSAKVKKGRVISQRPRPGTNLAAGSKVKLKISKGKRP